MFQDPGSITNIQQPLMFANPSQNAFSGSTLHEASSKQFQISENKEQKVRPNIRHGNQVTDSLVEGLKRDIRIYIEKCSMLVTTSKQNQQENQVPRASLERRRGGEPSQLGEKRVPISLCAEKQPKRGDRI